MEGLWGLLKGNEHQDRFERVEEVLGIVHLRQD